MKPILRAQFAPKVQMKGQWPKTINLLESGLKDELSMRKMESSHSRLVMVGKNTTNNLSKKSSPPSSLRMICSYLFLSDLYRITVLKCTMIFP